tara:strand:- start:197 stop:625 length:429 start_codon:yes stop_codon:yes gene_type:complete
MRVGSTTIQAMIKLLRQLNLKTGSKLKHSPKTAAKVRAKKSTFHLKRGGFKGGKPQTGYNPHRTLDVNIAARRMRQRGENVAPLYTSSSGRRMDSSGASARFAGRRRLKTDVDPYMGPNSGSKGVFKFGWPSVKTLQLKHYK